MDKPTRTKAVGRPTCRLCKHAHWSHEPHVFAEGGEGKRPSGGLTTDWQARALKAEAELAAIRRKEADRKQRNRDKRKQKNGGQDQQLQTGPNHG